MLSKPIMWFHSCDNGTNGHWELSCEMNPNGTIKQVQLTMEVKVTSNQQHSRHKYFLSKYKWVHLLR